MATLTDRTIAALRTGTDELAARLPDLTPDQLREPSAATEWSIAQVLSHLGSGAEIGLATLRSALDGTRRAADEENKRVWDRWNALDPDGQATGFLAVNEEVTAAFEALTAEQREALEVDLGFGPMPVVGLAGIRLNELTLHSWDVAAGLDSEAELPTESASVLLDQFSGPLGFMLGFVGHADQLSEATVLSLPGSDLRLAVDDRPTLARNGAEPTADFVGPLEAVVRLLGGRLRPEYTPAGVSVSGNVTLDDLRRVFPGF